MTNRESEKDRREQAQERKGDVVPRSGKLVEPKSLEQMLSVRLNSSAIALLRNIAQSQRVSVSSLIRTAVGEFTARSGQVTQIRWRVITSEGTHDVGTIEWQESPNSRASLREVKQGEVVV